MLTIRSKIASSVAIISTIAAACISETAPSVTTQGPSQSDRIPMPPSEGVAGSPSTSFGPPPLNALETLVIAALAELNVEGMRGELPFDDAQIWAQLGSGRELFVSAVPVPSDRAEFVAAGQRAILGLVVERGSLGPSEGVDRFVCREVNFYVRGDLPPGFVSIDDFLESLIEALHCAS